MAQRLEAARRRRELQRRAAQWDWLRRTLRRGIRPAAGSGVLLLMLAALWLSSPPLPEPPVSQDAPQSTQAQELLEGRVVSVRPLADATSAAPAVSPSDVPDDSAAGAATIGQPSIVAVEITKGSQAGRTVRIELGTGIASLASSARRFHPGDSLVIAYLPAFDAAGGSAAAEDGPDPFQIVDHVRRPWLLWAVALFAVVIGVVARGQGVRALVGLTSAVLVLWWFVIPRLLAGQPPVPIALLGCALIAVPSLLLTHGASRHGLVPLAGIAISLALVGVLTGVAVDLARLTGLASNEEINLVYVGTQGAVDPQGLLLAGMLIGVVGGLVDVTVAQAASVFEFHTADPSAPRGELFQRGMRVGQAHVAAAVHTLVLAYAGAALPMLLLFALYGTYLDALWDRELIAAELFRAVAGSVGLAASMPITTWLATLTCRPVVRAGAAARAVRAASVSER
jgi:uncharacterized membrane protein